MLPLAGLFSCKKQAANTPDTTTYIKTIINNSGNYIAVNCFPLSDGNYLLIGKDPSNNKPGLMVKFSENGSILWEMNISPLLTVLWKAFPLPGGGFIAAGFDATFTDNKLNVIIFDNNGSILSTATFNPGNGCGRYPLEMLQLNNGGFAFAGSAWDDFNNPIPYLLITDNALNKIFYKVYEPLNEENSYGVTGLYETPDGIINVSGFVYFNNVDNAYLIRIYPWGIQESFSLFKNNNIFETPGCIAINNMGNLILPNASANISNNNGNLVNYKNTGLDYISGTIGINTLDTVGNFTGLMQYSGYSNNGLINSISSTQDGGYILCGTVNQLNIQNSNTEIFVLKLDGSLHEQWSKSYDTYYPSYGVSAFQTGDGGYIIAGYHNTFSNYSNMMIIKTDANGNVN